MNPTQLAQIKRNMIKCATCHQLFEYTPNVIQVRPVEGFPDVEEVGVVCSHYNSWPKNVAYLNSDLKRMQQELKTNPSRELRRQYQRDFNKFQGKMIKLTNKRLNVTNTVS